MNMQDREAMLEQFYGPPECEDEWHDEEVSKVAKYVWRYDHGNGPVGGYVCEECYEAIIENNSLVLDSFEEVDVSNTSASRLGLTNTA